MYNFLKGRLAAVRVTLLVTAGILILIGIATIYSVGNVPRTDGPIGLWARGAAATCFSDVSVSVGGAS